MSFSSLENLVKTGQLKIEPFNQQEFNGLMRSGKARFNDALTNNLANESRYDLAYNAAHSFALAALRRHGYRPSHRYVVFLALPLTTKVNTGVSRVLAKCHDRRNAIEYTGDVEIDEQLLKDLITAVQVLMENMDD